MAFKLENQYTYLFEDFQVNNGYDIFMRYQDKNTTDDEREYLESVVKGWILDNNYEVARLTYSDDYMLYNVNSLMSLNVSDIYSDCEFGVNSIGVSVLQTFFPELEGVDKVKGCCMRDFCKRSEKSFTRYVRKLLKYGKSPNDMRSMFAFVGAGYCSNFRPATAKTIYELYGKENSKVLDTSSGFGGRLLGFFTAKNTSEYVGIDPNTADSCNKFIEFMQMRFGINKKAYVNKIGSEDFTIENYPQYENYFDISFTSPPYFDTEKYSDSDTQSYKKFNTYDAWVDGFYRNTIYNSCNALKLDGTFAINIFEKVDNIKEYTEEFLNDCGFYIIKEDKYLLRVMSGTQKGEDGEFYTRKKDSYNYEPIWVAKHYTELLRDGMITREKAEECYNRVKFGNKKISI
nr:MAG TPA: Putative modification methylase [Bacteriophage sp.]